MNQKQKIILLLSSTSLGGAILLYPFLEKSSSPKKSNDQHLRNNYPEEEKNNQQLPSVKKKKSSVLQIILIIIGIIIFIFIIFLIIKKRKELNNYLSGKLYIQYIHDLKYPKIKVFFCPWRKSLEAEAISQKLYDLDININDQDLPQEVQKIYQGLKTDNHIDTFQKFGQLIIAFFDFFDGHLLKAIDNDRQKNKIKKRQYFSGIKSYFSKIKTTDFSDKPIEVENLDTIISNVDYTKEISFKENEDPIKLFKTVMNVEEKQSYIKIQNDQKHFLFLHYYVLYDELIRCIIKDLDPFFQRNPEYQEQYGKKFQKIKNDIEEFLKVDHQQLIN